MSVAEARIRVGFIDGSDRAVLRMCAGYADSDGYSSGSEFGTRLVELKCDGYADHSESASYAGGSAVLLWPLATVIQGPNSAIPAGG